MSTYIYIYTFTPKGTISNGRKSRRTARVRNRGNRTDRKKYHELIIPYNNNIIIIIGTKTKKKLSASLKMKNKKI